MSSWQWKDAAGRPLALWNEAAAEPFRGAGSSFGSGQNEAATGPFRGTRTKGLYGHSWHWKEACKRPARPQLALKGSRPVAQWNEAAAEPFRGAGSSFGSVQKDCTATAGTGSKRQEGQWHSDCTATASSGRMHSGMKLHRTFPGDRQQFRIRTKGLYSHRWH